jgi:receptor protein-tyrosine kinase
MGAAIALLAAAGAAVASDGGDSRVRTDADVKRHLDLATLAIVEEDGQPLVLRARPADPLSETYSAAAAVLRGYLKERDFRVVAVTSAGAGEGKSTTAANLAVALARKGLNVAIVDGDLRRPRLHEVFGVENAQGLSTVLLGGEVDPELAAGATELAGLRLLPSGPTADLPGELLESGRMGELLRALRERYDVVLVDAPPLGRSGDAATLSRLADTVVWVIRSGASTRGELGWTRHLLKNLRADVAGAVLSFAPRSGERRSYVFPSSNR